jgi:hypothetical protein
MMSLRRVWRFWFGRVPLGEAINEAIDRSYGALGKWARRGGVSDDQLQQYHARLMLRQGIVREHTGDRICHRGGGGVAVAFSSDFSKMWLMVSGKGWTGGARSLYVKGSDLERYVEKCSALFAPDPQPWWSRPIK